jgi:hypothetical protein
MQFHSYIAAFNMPLSLFYDWKSEKRKITTTELELNLKTDTILV